MKMKEKEKENCFAYIWFHINHCGKYHIFQHFKSLIDISLHINNKNCITKCQQQSKYDYTLRNNGRRSCIFVSVRVTLHFFTKYLENELVINQTIQQLC